jgi:hypothetical protein
MRQVFRKKQQKQPAPPPRPAHNSTPATREDLAARRQRMAEDGALAMAEYLAEQKAVTERTARLRAERLAREAREAQKAR